MNCNIVRDLLPLYIDECCSEQSAEAVREHLASCEECRAVYDGMRIPAEVVREDAALSEVGRINHWLASLLQSALLFLSFAVVVLGVAFEAGTSNGSGNSFWAFTLVIPATGFMLSLANWFFVRLYKSRRQFRWCSVLVSVFFIVCTYTFGGIHYDMGISDVVELFRKVDPDIALKLLDMLWNFFGKGIIFSLALCILSLFSSDKYAKLLGKE